MKLKLHGSSGTSAQVQVSETAFGSEYNEPLIHQVITAYLAGGRAGTKAQKTRAQARGGGVKPWRQKGTGRARVGSIRNPIWRGGGRAFAAKPRKHAQKVNRKMYIRALQSIFSELVRQDRLVVTKELKLDAPKTRELADKLKVMGLDSVLILTEGHDENLILASRNLPHVETLPVSGLDPVSLIRHEKVLATVDAVRRIEERFA